MVERDITEDMFTPLDKNSLDAEKINRPIVTYWQDAWARLKRNKAAMASLMLLVLLVVVAIIGPFMNDFRYSDQNYSELNLKPFSAAALENNHFFGTDDLGRDIWQRIWVGTKISLFIGVMAALLDLIIGVLYGAIAGYKGGKTDTIMMRIIEVVVGIPQLILVILLVLILGGSLWTIILAMAISGWMGMARLTRGQILQLKEQEFVMAATTLGADTKRMILKHLIPNALGPILVTVTFTIPSAIFTEATLSFIGVGLEPPLASLGSLVNDGYKMLRTYSWNLWFPAAVISIIILAFNILGDGLRDAFDPKMRK
ncbi:ABC transporter permease [Rubeoparvulum massiliense]|uniref:ABC transporter permease n=1 Tax=Rubeoparvulum massiliense TaxID=1631346 RepID=UPI00065E2F49|nr:ABC transporter permease [Rubeoparvulum massiliense]